MSTKELIGFVCLAGGIIGAGGGIALVSRAQSMGWVGLLIAPFLLFVAYRQMRLTKAA